MNFDNTQDFCNGLLEEIDVKHNLHKRLEGDFRVDFVPAEASQTFFSWSYQSQSDAMSDMMRVLASEERQEARDILLEVFQSCVFCKVKNLVVIYFPEFQTFIPLVANP